MELKTKKLSQKNFSDELSRPGDFCVVEKLVSVELGDFPRRALVMLCPYCGGAMATTGIHKIEMVVTWPSLIFNIFTFGYAHMRFVPTIKPMLNCPYNKAHKFNIVSGKIKAIL